MHQKERFPKLFKYIIKKIWKKKLFTVFSTQIFSNFNINIYLFINININIDVKILYVLTYNNFTFSFLKFCLFPRLNSFLKFVILYLPNNY